MRADPLTIRPATAADFALHVRLMPELEVDDPPPVREKWVADQCALTLVAELAGVGVGTCFWQRLDGSGYVRQLIVAPEARRHGVGRVLMEEVARQLRGAGCTTWRLNVKPQNTAAVALYTSLGFRREYGSTSLKVEWPVLERLPVSAAVSLRVIEPEDDAAVEQVFALPAGQLAGARSPQRVLLQLVNAADVPVGLAVFSPAYPGAFPFRVKDLQYTRALLEGLQVNSLPGATYTGVVVENDDALARQLRDAGAVVRMAFDHYLGRL